MNFPTYVFATVNSGRATKVVEELKRNSQIDIIAPVTGRWDLVLRLKPNTPHNIYQTVREIREISDVRTTDTHTGFDGMQPTKKLESQMALGVSVLTCEHNTSESVIKQLSSIPGFIEATTVPGQFDIVALWQVRVRWTRGPPSITVVSPQRLALSRLRSRRNQAAGSQAQIMVWWVDYSIDSNRHLSAYREPCKAKESIILRNPHSDRKEGFS